ncbi:hypothetical protein MUB42_04420 [Apilactobacillus kunkeei]|nr:hypothetical protein MUB42_04420 [Apilactobacillus kunkeei]
MKVSLKKLLKTTLVAGIVSTGLMMASTQHAKAETNLSGNTQVSLKKDASLYDTQKIKKIKTKSAKKYFGKDALFEKKSAKVKKTTYKLVESKNGKKSGWVKSADLYVVKRKITNKSSHQLSPRINDSVKLDNRELTQLTDAQIKSRIRTKFVNFVQSRRRKTSNGKWILSRGLDKVAQERANYVNPTMGKHLIT